jgi:UDP-N-acetylmuramoyl-tripeptide--D-alanyl-D-alanine ligase
MNIAQIHDIFLRHSKISSDTRNIEPNSLFFALKGSNFNGNHFALKALELGAAFAIVDEKTEVENNKFILVENVLETLQQLAAYHRNYINVPVIALTGSNGKTTCKELLKCTLSQKFNVLATSGNLNNHIGVPLTLLQLSHAHDFAVIEMGANHQKEIELLCSIAQPNYGIITNIGKAHLEGFGGIEGVLKGKSELYVFLKKSNGLVFLRNEDSKLVQVAKGIEKITFGETNEAFLNAQLISDFPFVEFEFNSHNNLTKEEKNTLVKSKLTGKYNFYNMIAAACVASYFNISNEKIKQALETYTPQNNRSEIITKNSCKIYLDAYNANPTSMALSIENFAKEKLENKVLIIGEMNELGEDSDTEHTTIVDLIESLQFKNVFLIGTKFKSSVSTKPFVYHENTDLLLDYLSKTSFQNTAFLLKGSRSNALEKLVEKIQC